VLLEIRQDLITDRDGVAHWTSFVYGELKEVLTDPDIFQLRSKQHG
jgi:predicted N-formylglutamate amidohydrolase